MEPAMDPSGHTLCFSVHKHRPACSAVIIQAEKVKTKKNSVLAHHVHSFKLHTYQSCLNTVGLRKGPFYQGHGDLHYLGGQRCPFSDSENHIKDERVT